METKKGCCPPYLCMRPVFIHKKAKKCSVQGFFFLIFIKVQWDEVHIQENKISLKTWWEAFLVEGLSPPKLGWANSAQTQWCMPQHGSYSREIKTLGIQNMILCHQKKHVLSLKIQNCTRHFFALFFAMIVSVGFSIQYSIYDDEEFICVVNLLPSLCLKVHSCAMQQTKHNDKVWRQQLAFADSYWKKLWQKYWTVSVSMITHQKWDSINKI